MSSMKAVLVVGAVLSGAILYIYQWYSSREEPHGYGGRGPRSDFSDEDFIEIEPGQKKNNKSDTVKLPEPGDLCTICRRPLIKIMKIERKYSIVSLPQCGHWFHHKCALRLLEYHPNCPVCRSDIDSSSLRRRTANTSTLPDESEEDST